MSTEVWPLIKGRRSGSCHPERACGFPQHLQCSPPSGPLCGGAWGPGPEKAPRAVVLICSAYSTSRGCRPPDSQAPPPEKYRGCVVVTGHLCL